MATAYIVELAAAGIQRGHAIQVPFAPAVADQRVTYTTTTQSAAFNDNTAMIELDLDDDAYVAFGTNPTATTSTWRIKSSSCPRYFAVRPGDKIAIYDGSS